MVTLGLVQRQVWRLWRATQDSLCPHASSKQRRSLPPAGGREEVLPRQLFMTRPGQEGEERKEGEEGEEREEIQEREEGTQTAKQQ